MAATFLRHRSTDCLSYDWAACLPEMQSAFAGNARQMLCGYQEPARAWRNDRVLILTLSIALHSAFWLLWKQPAVAVTAPRLLSSVEVALVTTQPAVQPAPPVSQPQPEKPPEEKPKPKPAKPRSKSVAKPEKRMPVRTEPAVPAEAATPAAAAPAPAVAAAPSVPFVEASYQADYLHNPPPKYPSLARERHWEGTVVLRVQVLPDGSSGTIGIERSSGHDSLDEAAAEAARDWNFVAAKRGEETVASWVLIPIEFKLKN